MIEATASTPTYVYPCKVSRRHFQIWPAYLCWIFSVRQRKISILQYNQVVTSNYVNITHVSRTKLPISTKFSRDWPWRFAEMYMSIPRPEPRGVFLFYFGQIYLVVYSTYMYVHKCLEECRNRNQTGSCTPRPPCILLCWFPWHRRHISSDITSSYFSSTSTKTKLINN